MPSAVIARVADITKPLNFSYSITATYPNGYTSDSYAAFWFLKNNRLSGPVTTLASPPMLDGSKTYAISVVKDGHYNVDLVMIPRWGFLAAQGPVTVHQNTVVFYQTGPGVGDAYQYTGVSLEVADINDGLSDAKRPGGTDPGWVKLTVATPADLTKTTSADPLQQYYTANQINEVQFINLYWAFVNMFTAYIKDFDFGLVSQKEAARRLKDKYDAVDLSVDLADFETAQYVIESVEGEIY